MHVCMDLCTNVHMYVCMYHMYALMNAHMHVRAHTCTHMHTCMYKLIGVIESNEWNHRREEVAGGMWSKWLIHYICSQESATFQDKHQYMNKLDGEQNKDVMIARAKLGNLGVMLMLQSFPHTTSQ